MKARERGIVVLVLLVTASLAGSALLGVHSFRVSIGAHEKALSLKSDLLYARDALISYTAHYPYLYGARGSGVGHFPCPDTDGSIDSTGAVWSQRLGPNPPCGSLATAEGLLPAHISFPHHRYSFATHVDAPIFYHVSGRFINNPINRVVNPEVVLDAQNFSMPLIVLNQTVSRITDSYPNNIEAVITPAMLLLSTKPSVASWLVKRLDKLGSLSCALASRDGGVYQREQSIASAEWLEILSPSQREWCIKFTETSKRCDYTGHFSTTSVMTSEMGRDNGFRVSEETHNQFITVLAADEFPNDYDCEKTPESQLFIEGAPAKSHWFIRNHWAAWMKLVIDEVCVLEAALNCVFKKTTNLSKKASPLLIHWGLE